MKAIGYVFSMIRTPRYVVGLLTAILVFMAAGLVKAQEYSIELAPEEATLQVNQTLMVDAQLVSEDGSEVDTTFSWSSSNQAVATVSDSGLVTAQSEGNAEITASFGDSTATLMLEVEEEIEGNWPRIVINTPKREFEVGETADFSAYILMQDSTRQDTTIRWSVADTSVATIDSTGSFEALAEGETSVQARFDSLMAAVEVEVESGENGSDPEPLSVVPEDTAVVVGSSVQYSAVWDTSASVTDSTISWSVEGNMVGTIDSTGRFTATNTGIGIIQASSDGASAGATVIVQDSTADSTGTQSITIIKPRPNELAPVDTTVIHEGESYKMSGFPFPFNLLNGTMVHFPHGSLTEDVTLTIEMPEFATVHADTITYEEKIVTGISFHVSVDDSLHSPYYFEKPLVVSMPYKRGLIHNVLGITPDQLGMFFYDSQTGKDTTGISEVIVDSTSNRIFASVAHFSNLVLAPNQSTTSIGDQPGDETKPSSFQLKPNYPNPFNPATTISYTLPSDSRVTLEVFNLLGKRVATLVDGKSQQRGRHTVQFNASNLSSGVYMYRIKAGTHTAVRKMTLMK